MGSRYWITGVQLGLLVTGNNIAREKLVNKIGNEQYLGDKKDLKRILKLNERL